MWNVEYRERFSLLVLSYSIVTLQYPRSKIKKGVEVQPLAAKRCHKLSKKGYTYDPVNGSIIVLVLSRRHKIRGKNTWNLDWCGELAICWLIECDKAGWSAVFSRQVPNYWCRTDWYEKPYSSLWLYQNFGWRCTSWFIEDYHGLTPCALAAKFLNNVLQRRLR